MNKNDLEKKASLMNRKEWIILLILVGTMGIMGLLTGMREMIVGICLGLLIWLVWRGRNL